MSGVHLRSPPGSSVAAWWPFRVGQVVDDLSSLPLEGAKLPPPHSAPREGDEGGKDCQVPPIC
eukprot:3408593-Rhodomonas_salina.2